MRAAAQALAWALLAFGVVFAAQAEPNPTFGF
jgi:hypothetical protein